MLPNNDEPNRACENSPTKCTSPPKRFSFLVDKEFVTRNSVLTDLFQNSKHFQAIEHATFAALFFLALANIVSDYFEKTRKPNLELLASAFANYQLGARVWAKMMLTTLSIFPIVLFWAHQRHQASRTVDRLFLITYICYQSFFLKITHEVLFAAKSLGPAMATAISVEQIRLMAKMHSFVREVSKNVMKSQTSEFPCFIRYIYFLFAPTLIYRDVYPQNKTINWRQVVFHFSQFVGCLIGIYAIFERFVMEEFESYLVSKRVSLQMMVKTAVNGVLPTFAIFCLFFYGFFHSWLNAWAEMLRFGDRLFYRDWWTVSNFSDFYRKWNCIVHDWLFVYVYVESRKFLKVETKIFPSLIAFTLSSIFHEYVATSMFQTFFPLMLVNLGFGFLLTLIKTNNNGRLQNVAIWFIIFYGYGTMFYMYLFEISARRRCSTSNNFELIPRFVSCFFDKK